MGKTTVASKLLKLLPGWYYYHHTRPPMDAYEYFARFFTTARPEAVVDRCHLCEWVYGHATRGGSALSDQQWRMLELYCLAQGVRVLLLTDTYENIASRYSANEMFPVETQRRVVELYEDVAGRTKLPVTRFNLRDLVDEIGKPTPRLAGIVADEKVSVGLDQRGLLPPALGCGAPGGFLVVGEAPGEDGTCRVAGGPFQHGFSAEWLWRALDESGVRWWEGYYANASSFGDAESFRRYVKNVVSPEVVVCLGKVAQELAYNACIPHEPVSHPHHARRFKHGDFEAWRRVLTAPLERWVDQGTGEEK